jgi:hypothetical protein
MPHIMRVLAVPAAGAYYSEDLTALQSTLIPLSDWYMATPVTSGFHAVRQQLGDGCGSSIRYQMFAS